ncbi:hypothetical protein ACSBR2_013959 [Camellia fascicularis]
MLEPLIEDTFLPVLPPLIPEFMQLDTIPWEFTLRGHLNQAIVLEQSLKLQQLRVIVNFCTMQGNRAFEHTIQLYPYIHSDEALVLGPEWNSLKEEVLNKKEFVLPLLPLFRAPMKVLLWNCRGAANPHFRRHFRSLLEEHHPQLVVITETHIGGDRGMTICKSLGLPNFHISEPIGFARGIWLIWNGQEIHCDVLSVTQQEIHTCIQVLSSPTSWLFSAIYASPCFNTRKILWENLKIFADVHNLPWLLMGDFNEVLTSTEKFGGQPINHRRALLFKDCLDHYRLIDMGISGPRFTWNN